MPVTSEKDDRIIGLITREARKFNARIKEINLEKQIFDIECPDENRAECAVALQKILDKHGAT